MSKRQAPRSRQKEEFWRKKIAEQQASGLSQTAYCEREGLNANTFSSWKKILQERDAEKEVKRALKQASVNRAARAAKASFIPLVPATSEVVEAAREHPSTSAVAEVEVAGARLRVYNGADCRTLCAIIRAMRETDNAR
jgi:hypothetical protein